MSPDWRSERLGSRNRVALWLDAEVGVGGVFTKAQLRDAFPRVEQIDRRMRDLRREGWVITTYREDRTLEPDELRLVERGGAVWEPAYRSSHAGRIPDKVRNAILSADGFRCVRCGIGAGDAYADDVHHRAQLSVAQIEGSDGDVERLLTVCDRCRKARGEPSPDAGEVLDRVSKLSDSERAQLRGWMLLDIRQEDPVDATWVLYRQLSATDRARVQRALEEQ